MRKGSKAGQRIDGQAVQKMDKPLAEVAEEFIKIKEATGRAEQTIKTYRYQFFNAMRAAGYDDVERGERGSSEEHLTVAQFKTTREQERLAGLERQVEKKGQVLQKIEQKIEVQKGVKTTFAEIDSMGRKTLLGKVELSPQEAKDLKQLAKKGVAADSMIGDLQRDLKSARRDAQIWKRRYEELKEQTKDFFAAIKKAPEQVRTFISKILHSDQVEQTNIQQWHKKAIKR